MSGGRLGAREGFGGCLGGLGRGVRGVRWESRELGGGSGGFRGVWEESRGCLSGLVGVWVVSAGSWGSGGYIGRDP